MSRIALSIDQNTRGPLSGGRVQKPVNLTQATWHAQIAGGSAVNVTSAWSDPDPDEADRVPELALSSGGTPGTYTLTGTYDGKTVTRTITTVAGATVKGDGPIDAMASLVGPDPGAGKTLDIYKGDSWFSPPVRALQVGSPGAVACQLAGESKVTVKQAFYGDWQRDVQRIEHAGDGRTLATGLEGVW